MKMADNCPFCRAKTPRSHEECINQLRPWVKKKKAWAQNVMAQMYRDGEGVKQSHEMARMLYELAAQQGEVGAMCYLGDMYAHGRGVEQSYETAFEYYKQAAELGFANGQFNLGTLYYNGIGVEVDTEKAKKWWRKGAAQGHEQSIATLKQTA